MCLVLNGNFTVEDIRKAYIRAGVRSPKVVTRAPRDAKNRADFIDPGSKKGTFKLSPHGDRTVRFDLPKQKWRPLHARFAHGCSVGKMAAV
jgi:hypothetical protein